MQRLCEIHDKLLQAIGTAHGRLGERKLTTFFPMQGSAATGELMVVGRAVNGWGNAWAATKALTEDGRADIIRDVFERTTTPGMRWVTDLWGTNRTVITAHPQGDRRKRPYSTKTSAFWRVVRGVSESVIGVSEDWPSKLMWSNLYKVAPFSGGNPWTALVRTERDACKCHLAEEVSLWSPKRILFLTGWRWAEPFLSSLGTLVGRSGLDSSSGRAGLSGQQELPPKSLLASTRRAGRRLRWWKLSRAVSHDILADGTSQERASWVTSPSTPPLTPDGSCPRSGGRTPAAGWRGPTGKASGASCSNRRGRTWPPWPRRLPNLSRCP